LVVMVKTVVLAVVVLAVVVSRSGKEATAPFWVNAASSSPADDNTSELPMVGAGSAVDAAVVAVVVDDT